MYVKQIISMVWNESWSLHEYQLESKICQRILKWSDNTRYKHWVCSLVCTYIYTEPTLKELLNALHSVRASWFNIGLELGIPHTELIRFTKMYSDPLELLREVLKHWLINAVDPHPTWEAVVIALKSPSVNEKYVAQQLESKYCSPVQSTGEESNSQKSHSPDNNADFPESAASKCEGIQFNVPVFFCKTSFCKTLEK